MDKKLKTKKVRMNHSGATTEIGSFEEGQILKLPEQIAEAVVSTGVGAYITNKTSIKKTEVTNNGS